MTGTLIKAAAMLFVPAILLFFTSEFLGVEKKYMSSDALLQAMGEIFKNPTAGRIIVSLLWVLGMSTVSGLWSRFVHEKYAPEVMQIAGPSGQAGLQMLCSAADLEGRSFAGPSPEGHITLRINRVRGTEVNYSLLRGGLMQNEGKGAFDQSNCTLLIADLSSRAHAIRDGANLSLVAVDPRWTLRYFETR
jgi:hypothetical protein